MHDQELRLRASTTAAQMSVANGSPCRVADVLRFRMIDLEIGREWHELAESLADLEGFAVVMRTELEETERAIGRLREEVAK